MSVDENKYLCEANLVASGPVDAIDEFATIITILDLIGQSRIEERTVDRLRFTFKGASSQPFRIVENLASRGQALMLEGICGSRLNRARTSEWMTSTG